MIISASIYTTDRRLTNLPVDNGITLKELLEQNSVNYTSGTTCVDGVPVSAGDMNKSLFEFGADGTTPAKSSIKVQNVAKQDNA